MRRHFVADAHETISARLRRRAKVAYTLFDDYIEALEYATGLGGYHNDCIAKAHRGDTKNVAQSDAYLAKFEGIEMFTPVRRWREEVAGFVPNVPAFIAGHPASMRRRVKLARSTAPLVITADLSGSIGIGLEGMLKRSCAILALVRILTSSRPVELWIGAHFGTDLNGTGHGGCFVRVPTNPMELGVVTNLITDTSLVRYLFLKIDRHDNGTDGSWSFNNTYIERSMQRELLSSAFPNVEEEILAIPAAHVDDMLSQTPEDWLREQVARYSPQEVGL